MWNIENQPCLKVFFQEMMALKILSEVYGPKKSLFPIT